jgi:hypothetical protein
MGKLLDNTRIRALGWRPAIDEIAGLATAYDDFLQRFDLHASPTIMQSC